MTLQFPTLAEQCLTEWRAEPKTNSLVNVAKRLGATREKDWRTTIWRFDDDTSLVVTGSGVNHHVEVQLP